LATDETLQVSANGTDWVITTGSNKTWTTIDNAVTLIAGTGKTLTARVIALSLVIRSLPNTPASLLIATVCVPTGASAIVVSMVISEVSPEPFTVLPNKVLDNLTCMAYFVLLSNDAGVLGNDRITNDSAVKVSLTLGNNLVLATDETLQVSANGTDWVITTGSNKTWTTIDNAVTLIAGTCFGWVGFFLFLF
jgi:hypothetical protein